MRVYPRILQHAMKVRPSIMLCDGLRLTSTGSLDILGWFTVRPFNTFPATMEFQVLTVFEPGLNELEQDFTFTCRVIEGATGKVLSSAKPAPVTADSPRFKGLFPADLIVHFAIPPTTVTPGTYGIEVLVDGVVLDEAVFHVVDQAAVAQAPPLKTVDYTKQGD